jgi:hypothetical protein
MKKEPFNSPELAKNEQKLKKKEKKISDEKETKKIDDMEKFAEDENEFIKDLHRINYLTFSPFSLSFFNKNEISTKDSYDNTNEDLIREQEKENKLLKMINFDYNNYEFNEDLLFNICHGFINPEKLREEKIAGYGQNPAKDTVIFDPTLETNKKSEEKDSVEQLDSFIITQEEEEKRIKEEEERKKQAEISNEINRLNKEIDEFIKKKEGIDFYQEEIKNYSMWKEKLEENKDITNEEKMIFYKKWLHKFHEIETIYNNYRVQIQRTETIKKEREEKKKKEEEQVKLKRLNEDRKFIEELNKIKEKALRRKMMEEKGIIDESLYSDSSNKINSSSSESFATSHYIKGNNTSRMTGRSNKKKKIKQGDRADWMIKKSDNYFDKYL